MKPTIPNLSSGNSNDDSLLKAEVRLGRDSSSYLVEFSVTTTADELLTAILKEINPPKRDSYGQPNIWQLHTRQQILSGREILADLANPSETLVLYLATEGYGG